MSSGWGHISVDRMIAEGFEMARFWSLLSIPSAPPPYRPAGQRARKRWKRRRAAGRKH